MLGDGTEEIVQCNGYYVSFMDQLEDNIINCCCCCYDKSNWLGSNVYKYL